MQQKLYLVLYVCLHAYVLKVWDNTNHTHALKETKILKFSHYAQQNIVYATVVMLKLNNW
jgi:hypothetical protein